MNSEDILKTLNFRYATKKFDPQKKIAPEHWETLEQSMVLAPSSFGLQLSKYYVVKDPATREKLKAVAWNQSQVTDASHLVVFAVKRKAGLEDIDALVSRIQEVRGQSAADVQPYKDMMVGWWNATEGKMDRDAWMARQAYVALGFFLTSCAHLGIDACPMEGFDPGQFDEILGLTDYRSVVMATAGYRAADDKYAGAKKVRFPKEKLIEYR